MCLILDNIRCRTWKGYFFWRKGLKFLYLKKPNIIQENVISFIQDFPTELGLDKYIDYELQFDKSFVEPLRAILDAIGWNVEKTVNLESFFS